eukprot:813507-Amphidinium_carterae.1
MALEMPCVFFVERVACSGMLSNSWVCSACIRLFAVGKDVLVSDGALHLQGWFAVWQLLVACVFWMPV